MALARNHRAWLLTVLFPGACCLAQSTNGVITGIVANVVTREPLPGALVTAVSITFPAESRARTGADGRFSIPSTPPGTYRLNVELDGYQPGEIHELELAVAGYSDVLFELRPLSRVWEPGQGAHAYLAGRYLVDFYGPDVSLISRYLNPGVHGRRTLEATFSRVVDPVQVRELPFSGRDVYTMLVTAPGVSADSATARGLGVSATGQRSYSSHFLLDGLQADHSLVSGPLVALAPEAVQEYRISTNNWSAEFGNASGVLANAVTRSGTAAWHGIVYTNLKNDAFNANDFQDNLIGFERPRNELQPGFHAGGPILRERLFFSSALDILRSRSRQTPLQVSLPSTEFLSLYTQPGSAARRLLERYPAPRVSDGVRPTARWTAEPPLVIDRIAALERADLVFRNHRLMGRAALASTSRSEFVWSPYPDFTSALEQPAANLAGSWISSLSPRLTSEFRTGWSRYRTAWERAHPEIPTLSTNEGVVLPGSLAFYDFDNTNSHWELQEHLVWMRGRHVAKFGGGVLLRDIDNELAAGRDGHYRFGTIISFAIGRPASFSAAVSRQALPTPAPPDLRRSWRLRQAAWFVQDAVRITPRLSVNFGLRAENFGAPSAADDVLLRLGEGDVPAERLKSAFLAPPAAGRTIYDAGWNWAPRAGFSLALTSARRIVLRGAAGLFHDRPFDSLWHSVRNNSFVVRTYAYAGADQQFLAPVAEVLSHYEGEHTLEDFPGLFAIERGSSDAYARNFFLSLQNGVGRAWTLETALHGSSGRKLFATDQINRPFSIPSQEATPDNPDRVINPALPLVTYRSQAAASDYYALTASADYNGRRGQLHVAYTWSHAVDNQSDPLAGEFFDLDITRARPAAERRVAAFSRQFDANADRGNSDFDQRHNLVMFSIWDLPSPRSGTKRLLGGWRVSQIAGFRSGFPYSVFASSTVPESGGSLINNRADLTDPSKLLPAGNANVEGGRRMIEAAAFRHPAGGRVGNLGRNALRAPGFFNLDLSISRTFPLPAVSESASFTLRADVFNVLNHANLDMPDSQLGSPSFGIALKGRRGFTSGFPALFPLQETGRQIQLLLRFQF